MGAKRITTQQKEALVCESPGCTETFTRTHPRRKFCTARCGERTRLAALRQRPDWPELRAKMSAAEAKRAARPEVKERRLQRLYGITLADYQRMFEEQGGVCAICGGVQVGRDLVVDHCHETGRVRALLCGPCNSAIGLLGEDVDRLRRAIGYLENQ